MKAEKAEKAEPKNANHCLECGKFLDPTKTKNTRFCSIECRDNFYYKFKEEKKGFRACKFCGTTFSPQRTTQKFCKSDCREAYKRKLKKEQNKVIGKAIIGLIKNCLWCGKKFTAPKSNPHTKYCSEDCREKADRKQYRERKDAFQLAHAVA